MVGCGSRDLYIWWEKIGASSRSFEVLNINHVSIVKTFGCGDLFFVENLINKLQALKGEGGEPSNKIGSRNRHQILFC